LSAAGQLLGLPQENLLYFLEKTAPRCSPGNASCCALCGTSRSIFIRRARPKVMNEGTATYVHYRIMNRLHERDSILARQFPEFLSSLPKRGISSLTSTIRAFQVLTHIAGFAMMQDIERIVCKSLTMRSRMVSDIAGTGDTMGVLRTSGPTIATKVSQPVPQPAADAALSHVPPARRSGRERAGIRVDAIHDDRAIVAFARTGPTARCWLHRMPTSRWSMSILPGDRRLMLRHAVVKGAQVTKPMRGACFSNLADLWSYDVALVESTSPDRC